MKLFLPGLSLLLLSALPALADPAPMQSPAQLQASGSASTDAQMPSPADKAAAEQSGKAQVAANKAASNNTRKGGGIITDAQRQQKAVTDNGRNDGGVAAGDVTP
jgi:hypothetical protein